MCKKENEFVENGLEKLPRAFYDREADTVARERLGKYLVRVDSGRTRIGKIVETEAYLGPPRSGRAFCQGENGPD